MLGLPLFFKFFSSNKVGIRDEELNLLIENFDLTISYWKRCQISQQKSELLFDLYQVIEWSLNLLFEKEKKLLFVPLKNQNLIAHNVKIVLI